MATPETEAIPTREELIEQDPRYAHYGYLLAKTASEFNNETEDIRYHALGMMLNFIWQFADADGLSSDLLDMFLPE